MNEHTPTVGPRLASHGLFPVVSGNDVHVERAGGLIFFARRQLSVQQGGGQWSGVVSCDAHGILPCVVGDPRTRVTQTFSNPRNARAA